VTRINDLTGRAGWRVAVVLGSGLSPLGPALAGGEPISYKDIDGMPEPRVAGHEGKLYAGEVEGVPTLLFAGRVHGYEGHPPIEVAAWVRLAVEAGCDTIVITNAAGALSSDLEVGTPMLISDHLNLTGTNPLFGERRFLDLTDLYDPSLRALARNVDPSLKEGVYAGLLGPTYETPAEVRMLRTLGADLVGMSTVHEAIMARALGASVLGISVVTNLAAGLSPQPLSHGDVGEAAARAASRLEALLRGVIARL
jgi:purine-nucleoside phosphorylase